MWGLLGSWGSHWQTFWPLTNFQQPCTSACQYLQTSFPHVTAFWINSSVKLASPVTVTLHGRQNKLDLVITWHASQEQSPDGILAGGSWLFAGIEILLMSLGSCLGHFSGTVPKTFSGLALLMPYASLHFLSRETVGVRKMFGSVNDFSFSLILLSPTFICFCLSPLLHSLLSLSFLVCFLGFWCCCFFLLFFCFETRSCFVAQAGFKWSPCLSLHKARAIARSLNAQVRNSYFCFSLVSLHCQGPGLRTQALEKDWGVTIHKSSWSFLVPEIWFWLQHG